jgi:hypothetical protein
MVFITVFDCVTVSRIFTPPPASVARMITADENEIANVFKLTIEK